MKQHGKCIICAKDAVNEHHCHDHVIKARNRYRLKNKTKGRTLKGISIDDHENYKKERQVIKNKYMTGNSAKEIAYEYKLTQATVTRIVREEGGVIRSRGRPSIKD